MPASGRFWKSSGDSEVEHRRECLSHTVCIAITCAREAKLVFKILQKHFLDPEKHKLLSKRVSQPGETGKYLRRATCEVVECVDELCSNIDTFCLAAVFVKITCSVCIPLDQMLILFAFNTRGTTVAFRRGSKSPSCFMLIETRISSGSVSQLSKSAT